MSRPDDALHPVASPDLDNPVDLDYPADLANPPIAETSEPPATDRPPKSVGIKPGRPAASQSHRAPAWLEWLGIAAVVALVLALGSLVEGKGPLAERLRSAARGLANRVEQPQDEAFAATLAEVWQPALEHVVLQLDYEPMWTDAWPDYQTPWGHVPQFTLFDDGTAIYLGDEPGRETAIYVANIDPTESTAILGQVAGLGFDSLVSHEATTFCDEAGNCQEPGRSLYTIIRARRDGELRTVKVYHSFSNDLAAFEAIHDLLRYWSAEEALLLEADTTAVYVQPLVDPTVVEQSLAAVARFPAPVGVHFASAWPADMELPASDPFIVSGPELDGLRQAALDSYGSVYDMSGGATTRWWAGNADQDYPGYPGYPEPAAASLPPPDDLAAALGGLWAWPFAIPTDLALASELGLAAGDFRAGPIPTVGLAAGSRDLALTDGNSVDTVRESGFDMAAGSGADAVSLRLVFVPWIYDYDPGADMARIRDARSAVLAELAAFEFPTSPVPTPPPFELAVPQPTATPGLKQSLAEVSWPPENLPQPVGLPFAVGIQTWRHWFTGGSQGHLAHLKGEGFMWLKQRFAWRDIELRRNEFNRDNSRAYIDEAISGSVGDGPRPRPAQLIIQLDVPPDWAKGGDQAPFDLEAWGQFVYRFAVYHRGEVAAYEIMNEPNLAREWGGPPDPAAYARVLATAYKAVKVADPNAAVISAGLAPTGDRMPEAMADDTFLAALYDAMTADLGSSDLYFDVLGVHAPGFAAAPDVSPDAAAADAALGGQRYFTFRRVEDLRAIMVARGDEDKQVAVTEFGWTIDPRPDSPYHWAAVTREQRADYIEAAIDFANEEWWPWIGPMVLFSAADPAWTPDDEAYWWSVTTPDGRLSPEITVPYVGGEV